MRKLWLLSLLLMGVVEVSSAQPHYALTDDLRSAYQAVTELDYAAAEAYLAAERAVQPDNLFCHLLDNYLDFFRIFTKDDYQLYKDLLPNRAQRLKILRNGPEDSPYHRYIEADIRLQWALLRLRYGDYLRGFQDISAAFKLLQKNTELYPGFLPNKKDLAILHAAIGTVPDQYKWALRLLGGLKGSVEQGRRELEEVLAQIPRQQDFLFSTESRVLYTFLLLHLVQDESAAKEALNVAGLEPGRSPLHTFVYANVAMRIGDNEAALEVLKPWMSRPEAKRLPSLFYQYGLAKLRKLDPEASYYFQQYLNHPAGYHLRKEALQKYAWSKLLVGDQSGYRAVMQRILTEGHASAGGDKQALAEAKRQEIPHNKLLQARLLFDGGYYEEALKVVDDLEGHPPQAFEFILEMNYRRGRILHRLARYPEAAKTYRSIIATGRDHTAYYACSAALQLGHLYRTTGHQLAAQQAYKDCLDISPASYKTSLHQQAKAALAGME